MGEGMPHDAQLMKLIDLANISCGYHAGDKETIRQTIERALKYNVKIGAHPSYPDRKNFGRREMDLSTVQVHELVMEQLEIIKQLTEDQGATIYHVKPHGALYNASAKNAAIAAAISKAVFQFDPALILVGLSASHSIGQAKQTGLPFMNEVFADRRYHANGSLVSRTVAGATIENEEECLQQVSQIQAGQKIISIEGFHVPVVAETICIHGDSPNALVFAQAIHSFKKRFYNVTK